jgi:hypothetical protein
MTVTLEFKSAKDALDYCLNQCPRHELGCASRCELRKHWHIPPFGRAYP